MPEQILALYGTVYNNLSIDHLDLLLSFELADTLSGNFYHVDRDRLAYRVGAIANRATELILQKKKEKWKAQAQREMQDVHRKHSYDLTEEKQKRITAKGT